MYPLRRFHGRVFHVVLLSWLLTSVAVAEDQAPLVFEEDFSSPSALERFVFASPDHWQRVEVEGRHALEHTHAGSKGYAPPFRSPHNIALIAEKQFGSFVLEYDVQQTSREYGHRDACVFFNFEDPSHFYYTHVATKSDPHAHQIFTVDEAPRRAITQKGTTGFQWGPTDGWHHVKVERDLEQGTIRVFVDDMEEPIMEAKDTSHGWGYIGFGSFDDSGRVTNICIRAAETKSKRPDFFRPK